LALKVPLSAVPTALRQRGMDSYMAYALFFSRSVVCDDYGLEGRRTREPINHPVHHHGTAVPFQSVGRHGRAVPILVIERRALPSFPPFKPINIFSIIGKIINLVDSVRALPDSSDQRILKYRTGT